MSGSKRVIKVNLPAPRVLEISGGKLHVPDLNGKPATAEVSYAAMKVGDSIALVMDRLLAIYEITHIVSAPDVSSGKATIAIDNEFLADDLGFRDANLHYTVDSVSRSEAIAFTLTY
ncbi:hypothetical protein AWM79_10765 [Pseudomonas agarici]|uniref:Phage tail protein n=1 Tax=Pseudomonas agarici TaxID=46677 RepID=A0A0X1T106_PSEAA|nr:hypothetical protein [Pseudomonas agarici]AMB85755.1 hypothetical protein AWM79_10765 [Pseudomonas agarici]NWB89795.1 hypothetical protein [Pseudomonas agarici]NWC07241.1 hypothetical protein [Pseudomonas agarici]